MPRLRRRSGVSFQPEVGLDLFPRNRLGARGDLLAGELGRPDVGQVLGRLDEPLRVLGGDHSGPRVIAMDSHVDTVGVGDPAAWEHDPYRGKVEGGRIYGRGSSDQKAGIACLVCGPGDLDQAHQPDESIRIPALERGRDLVPRVLQRLCGARPAC